MYASGEIGKDEYELDLESINNKLVQYQLKLAEINETNTDIGFESN